MTDASGRRRGRPSPAIVISVIALFLSTTGVGVALFIPPNSINSKHVKPNALGAKDLGINAVGKPELGPKSVGLADLLANSVNNSKITNDAVGTDELSASIPAVGAKGVPNQSQFTMGEEESIAFATEEYDTAGMHSTAANNHRFTAVKAGIYLVTGYVNLNLTSGAPTSGNVQFALRDTPDTTPLFVTLLRPSFSLNQSQFTTAVNLDAGESVFLQIYNGTDKDMYYETPEINMLWIAPGPG